MTNRRNFLKASGAASAALIAGCGGGSSPENITDGGGSTAGADGGTTGGAGGGGNGNAGGGNTPTTRFDHGIASGDPTQSSVILWTRVTSDNTAATISGTVEVADNSDFTGATSFSVNAIAARDYTAKYFLNNLNAGQYYFYRFVFEGVTSPVGRTKTLPSNPSQMRIGLVSCSSLPHGYFHAYRRLANIVTEQNVNDIDFVVHLGDYIYEYPGKDASAEDPVDYGNAGVIAQGRTYPADHQVEIVELADYRNRFADYKVDEDLKALHALHPFFMVWDDHEIADNTYDSDEGGPLGGAFNHQEPGNEDANGANCPANQMASPDNCWQARKRNATQAYMEWMPIDDISSANVRGTFDAPTLNQTRRIGSLIDLSILDTRAAGREIQLADFHQGSQGQDRKIMSDSQENWIIGDGNSNGLMQTAESDGVIWKLLVQQVIMSPTHVTPTVGLSLAGTPGDAIFQPPTGSIPSSGTTYLNGDSWDAYTDQQHRMIDAFASIRNGVVLTGDVHTSWAFDLVKNPNTDCNAITGCASPAAVEFVCPSITSPGIDDSNQARTLEQGLQMANPHLNYLNLDRRGFVVLDITTTTLTTQWYHIDHNAHHNPTDSSLTLAQTATVAAKPSGETGTNSPTFS